MTAHDPVDAGASSPLLAHVRQLIDAARQRVASAVNAELTQLYWHIGRRISAELLQGQRGEYGKQVVAELARQRTADIGKGWSKPQRRCLQHTRFPKEQWHPHAPVLLTLPLEKGRGEGWRFDLRQTTPPAKSASSPLSKSGNRYQK